MGIKHEACVINAHNIDFPLGQRQKIEIFYDRYRFCYFMPKRR